MKKKKNDKHMQFQPYNHYSNKLTTIEILLNTRYKWALQIKKFVEYKIKL